MWSAGPPPLDGTIVAFSVSEDSQRIVLARWRSVELYELALLDMSTQQVKVLIPAQERNLARMAISPDGQWLAYILTDASPGAALPPVGQRASLAAPLASPLAGGGPSSGTIYAVRIDAPDQRIELGYCAEESMPDWLGECKDLYWSPDSHEVIWSDGRGVWLAELGRAARQVTANFADMHSGEFGGEYHVRSWSPLGRYVLAWSHNFEVLRQAVIDTETGDVAEIPDSGEFIYPGPRVAWMQDGRLFVTRSGDWRAKLSPSVELWRIDPTSATMLMRDLDVLLNVGTTNHPAGPAQLADGRLVFALLNGDYLNYTERGLYFLALNDVLAHRVTGLPPAVEGLNDPLSMSETNIFWTPDGTAAIVYHPGYYESDRTLWYVPTDGSPLLDLRPVLDEGDYQACCFVWMR
jgi:hypothetical protein